MNQPRRTAAGPRPRLRHGLVVSAAWLAVIAAAGIALGRAVTGPFGPFVSRELDAPVRDFLDGQHDPVWHHLSAHVSVFGTAFVTGSIAGLTAVLVSLRTRSLAIAVQCATAFAGAAALTIVVKFGVNRQPASGPLPAFAAGTFPSGHTLFAVSVYGTLGVLVLRSRAPRIVRGLAAALLTTLALAVGWSRVFLLDHYSSDIVGSVLIGSAWVRVVTSSPAAPGRDAGGTRAALSGTFPS